MAYQATVYNIMIGAPSDIKEEFRIAKEVIHEWNDIHSKESMIVLLPLNWKDNTYPSVGKHPQKIIDQQIVNDSDLLICIFGTKIGSPTDTHPSGTIEEIEEHRKNGKNVMVFFREQNNITDIDIEQYKKLQDFRKANSQEVFWGVYNNIGDFKDVLFKKISLFINCNWKKAIEEQMDIYMKEHTISNEDIDKITSK